MKFKLIINHNNKKEYHLQFWNGGDLIWYTPGYFNRADCVDVIRLSGMDKLEYEFETVLIDKK